MHRDGTRLVVHRHGAYERHCLHVHRDCDECREHVERVGGLDRGDPGRRWWRWWWLVRRRGRRLEQWRIDGFRIDRIGIDWDRVDDDRVNRFGLV
jgi:hypothetical protein